LNAISESRVTRYPAGLKSFCLPTFG